MLSLPRRYWPVIPIAAILVAASYLEWSHAHGPQQPSYAAAAQAGTSPSVADELPARTPDGRLGTKCYAWTGGGPAQEMCRVSFYRLIADPKQYDGTLVAVVGYLTDLFGTPALFATKESADAMIYADGVSLINPSIPSDLWKQVEQSGGVWPVSVVGIFDAKYLGHPETGGGLHDIKIVKFAGTLRKEPVGRKLKND